MKNRKIDKGSLTVEATLTLPIFMFILMFFIYFFHVLLLKDYLQQGITNVGYDIARHAYIYQSGLDKYEEKKGEIDETLKDISDTGLGIGYIYALFLKEIDEDIINNSIIKDDYLWPNLLSSSVYDCDDDIDIILKYYIEIPLKIFNLKDIKITQKAKVRAWTGFHISKGDKEEEAEKDSEIVYIARTGSVYHRYKECTYIKLSVKTATGNISNLRNKSGGKYHSCEICIKDQISESIFYITDYGTRYHNNSKCSGIKRDVIAIDIKEVGGRRPCSKCGE